MVDWIYTSNFTSSETQLRFTRTERIGEIKTATTFWKLESKRRSDNWYSRTKNTEFPDGLGKN